MKTIVLILSALLSFSALAECGAAYNTQIKNIEGRMNPPRTTVISNVIAEGAVVGALALVGTIPVTAVVALPAAALGAGAYYGYLVAQRDGLRNGMHVIRDAHKGRGKTLERFMKILNRKSDVKYDRDEVINFLVQADFDNIFCELNEVKDTYKVLTFRKIIHYTKKELAI